MRVAARASLSLLFVSSVKSQQCFDDGFMIGSATASYQVEGGWNETGRTPSIWDDFCLKDPNRACAKVADDFLHRYLDDIDRMAEMGLQSFRFSISWSRVMTWNGTSMVPNPEGVDFYHRLIRALKDKDIEPLLTMYHWDLPSALHDNLSPPGWLNPAIVDHFLDYAKFLYEEFGKDVRYWATFNEPWTFCLHGYGDGVHAPGMNNSTTNTYTAGHHVLLSHAVAVAEFREGTNVVRDDARIGIVLNCDAGFPLDPDNPDDVAAVERGYQFALGWFLEPIVSGDYPAVMKERAGERLPEFTAVQSKSLKGSYDLFMLNHYGSHVITDCDSPDSNTPCDELVPGWFRDLGTDGSRFPEGTVFSSLNAEGANNCPWFGAYPHGYLPVIRWMHSKDTTADILLTENGFCGNATVDNQDQLWYYQTYMAEVKKGVDEGIPIIGYTAWSLLDNYEWGSFEPRFGLIYVDFPPSVGSHEGYTPKDSDLKRTARPAADFIKVVATSRCLPSDKEEPTKPTFLSVLVRLLIIVLAAWITVKASAYFCHSDGYTPI